MDDGGLSKPMILLIVLAVLCGGVYGWRALSGGPAVEMRVTHGPGGVMFLFNGRVKLEEVKVTADPEGVADGPRVVWHLVPREDEEGGVREPAERMVVSYGRRWQMGLRPAEDAPRRAEPLVAGVTYEASVETTAGRALGRFTVPATVEVASPR